MDALLLATGAAAALAVAALAPRRLQGLPGLAAGVGLVLLLVAALRALGEAAVQAAQGQGLLVAAGLLVGAALWLLLPRRPGLREGAGAVAVVVAQVPLLVSLSTFDLPTGASFDVVGPSAGVLLALAGLLAGGAVAACRPPVYVAAACVALLAGLRVLLADVDPYRVTAAASAVAVAVLVPLLLEQASAPGGAWRSRGALLGVALVLLAAGAPRGAAEGMPRRYADYGSSAEPGLEVLSNDAYASRLQLRIDGPPLVPALGLLTRTGTFRFAG